MITSDKVFKVVKKFERVLPFAKHADALDMSTYYVSTPAHRCGTIHCHAGWYALAHSWDLKSHYLNGRFEFVTDLTGVGNMCRDLGFDTEQGLLLWARCNPEIWGNEYGDYMFASRRAFNYTGNLTLQKLWITGEKLGNGCLPKKKLHEVNMNTIEVQKAINKVLKRISKMSDKEVKDLVKNTPDKWGKLLLEGGFLDNKENR